MPKVRLVYGIRRAPMSPATSGELVATALDQCAWADEHGFYQVGFGEHHATADDYVPSPLMLASAAAARTRRMRIVPILLAPLYDPIRLAEDLMVLDLISGGRVEPIMAAGYAADEFAMFGKRLEDRVPDLEERVEVLKKAWTGEPFDYRGSTVKVRPRPLQQPRPPIILGGLSKGAARRAARIADGFRPGEPGHWEAYVAECLKLGREPETPGAPDGTEGGPSFLYVTEDPDAAWEQLAPYLLFNIAQYAQITTQNYGRVAGPFGTSSTLDALKTNPAFQVLTPDDCVAYAQRLDPHGVLTFAPLMAGLAPRLAWQSLELFAAKVLPRLNVVLPPELASGRQRRN